MAHHYGSRKPRGKLHQPLGFRYDEEMPRERNPPSATFTRGASTFFTDPEIKDYLKKLLLEEMKEIMREEKARELKWLRDTVPTVPETRKILWWRTSRGLEPIFYD